MRLLAADESSVTIELDRHELRAAAQALNEVCHGPEAIPESEFFTRMGVERDEAKVLLEALVKARQ